MKYTYKDLIQNNITSLENLRNFYKQPHIAKDYPVGERVETILAAILAMDRKLTYEELDNLDYKIWQWEEAKSCILHDRLRDSLR